MKEFVAGVRTAISRTVPWILSIILITVWIGSENHFHKPYFKNLLLLFILLGIIFFADSLEVAYSLLRYKDPEQFGGAEARILREMHADENLVYEAREWLVTVLIVAITLMAEFDSIYIPFLDIAVGPNLYIPGIISIQAKTLFSLLFTTLPVLWLAQGLSKRIARDCPQKILGAGSLIWELIKRVGSLTDSLGLNNPTAWLTQKLKQSNVFSDELNLKPSDNAFFIASLQRYGYALHDLYVHVLIDADGSCLVTERVLYYAISRPCNVFGRRLTFDTGPMQVNHFSLKTLKAYQGPVIQEADPTGHANRELKTELDTICRTAGTRPVIPDQLFTEIQANLDVTVFPDGDVPNRMHYRIDTHGSIPSTVEAFAILVEFTTAWSPGSFIVGVGQADKFHMSFDCPCYRYSLAIEVTPACQFKLSEITPEALCTIDPHWGERERLERSLCFSATSPKGMNCELYYPFPGIRYRLHWKNAV